jgi:hypothetical protein
MKTLLGLVLVLLTFVAGRSAYADHAEGVSGRMVLDRALELRAELRELEEEFARRKPDREKAKWLAAQVAEARARLAELEGRPWAAVAEWKKVLAHRTERLEQMTSGKICCSPREGVICRGGVAEARCRIAEIERDWDLLAAELPKAIAGYKARVEMYQALREARAIDADDVKDEQVAREELRKAERRFDVVRKKLGPA